MGEPSWPHADPHSYHGHGMLAYDQAHGFHETYHHKRQHPLAYYQDEIVFNPDQLYGLGGIG